MHRGKKLEWTGQVFRNLDCSVRLIRNVLAVLSSSPHAKLGNTLLSHLSKCDHMISLHAEVSAATGPLPTKLKTTDP